MPDHLVKKLSGGWAQDPILGPMYGPAYFVGTKVVRDAIANVGAKKSGRSWITNNGKIVKCCYVPGADLSIVC